MKKFDIALCDSCEAYILKFASYLMDNMDVGIHIFTTTESFYSDEGDYDIAIISEDFKEISEFRPKGTISHKYFLSEKVENEEINFIYKYQSITRIIDEIKEFRHTNLACAGTKNSNTKSKIIGIYSPTNHELQLPFSMAVSQANKASGKVLFLDLEEISILPQLVGNHSEKNLIDLLYEIDSSTNNLQLSEYVRTFMGVDYIDPFINPNEISEVESETWIRLFNLLMNTNYDMIVVLFGRTINGFEKCIEKLDKLYVLGKPGDYFRKGQDIFLDYIERLGIDINLENVILPMSANNLSDNSYQIEELLQGNLGVFVKRMLNANSQGVKENYG